MAAYPAADVAADVGSIGSDSDDEPHVSAGTITSWDDAIEALSAEAEVRHLVEVPELGGMRVWVRPLTRAETMQIMDTTTNPRTQRVDVRARDKLILLKSVVEPRLTAEQYDRLAKIPGASVALDRVQAKINELTTGVTSVGPDQPDQTGAGVSSADEGSTANPLTAAHRFFRRQS